MPVKSVAVKRKPGASPREDGDGRHLFDGMAISNIDPDKEKIEEWTQSSLRKATYLLGIFQITMIILFASCSTFIETDSNSTGTITQGYTYYIGVEIMMFIGFGYLMTFLKCYGLGAVGFTMLITAIGIQWYLFTESFFHQIYHYNSIRAWHNVEIDIYALMNTLFGVSAVLISFGALIGKIKPFQLVVLTLLELAFHAFNYECILEGAMEVADVGGTYADHMFGAYFGLAVAWTLRKQRTKVEPATGYVADIFSLIGTLFLWIYWPSFVGGAAQADSVQQQRAVMNTILSLSASTVVTFFLSSIMAKEIKFRPVDVQNATLAGGVAIGCTANFNMNPVNAIFIGSAAGLWSTFGFNVIQPYLFEKWGLHDTCGIHNLHAMPSVIGGIASIILAAYKQTGGRRHDGDVFSVDNGQAWRQLVSILLVMTFAIVSGYLTGLFLQWLEPNSPEDFDDSPFWEVANDYVYVNSETSQMVQDTLQESQHLLPRGKKDSSSHSAVEGKSNENTVNVFEAANAPPSNKMNASNHSQKLNQSNHSPRVVPINNSINAPVASIGSSFHGSKHGGYELVNRQASNNSDLSL